MKLAFCLFKYFPYSGLARDFLRVVQECHVRGHDVHIFVSDWEGERPEGIRINLLSVLPLANHSQNSSFYNQFRQRTRDETFDAIIGFNKMPGLDIYYGADYCYIARAVPRYGPLYRLTPRYHNFYSFERAVFDVRSSTKILSLSEREKGVYQQHYGTPESRFVLLPPTLDVSRKLNGTAPVCRDQKRESLGISRDQYLILFIGSGFKTKGLDRAIKAVDSLPHDLRKRARLYVIGQDNEHVFQRLIQKLGLRDNVHFLGGREDVVDIMTAGDVLIHPAYSENTGTVLLEAVTAGLPVLATDVCGYAPHITNADAGIVLRSPFQQQQLDEKLSYMLTAPEREEWRRNGLAYGRDDSLYRMPQTVADLIEQWVTDKRETPVVRETTEVDDANIYMREDVRSAFGEAPSFDRVMAITGEEVRKAPGRRTVRFKLNEKYYYLKTHTGVGWHEILKNLAYFRMPVLGAMNEWHGIHHLNRLGINTLNAAAYGTWGGSPARRRSFILTDEISDTISLEELSDEWKVRAPQTEAEIRFKRWLIQRTAEIARDIHNSGANHRDFYLCHFLLKRGFTNGELDTDKCNLFVIDLHRMQLRKRTPSRWAVKDIAGLYFSSKDIGLNKRDLFRFMRIYRSVSLRETITQDRLFWKRVRYRGENLYEAEKRRALRGAQAPATSIQRA
ncbi:MAG: lipopolysaccharide core heptose(I) kinase RfaP [Pseudomonadota bacterium]